MRLRVVVVFVLVLWLIYHFGYKSSTMGTEEVKTEAKPARKKGCPEGVEYTVDDVLKHRKCNFFQGDFDLWLVIGDKVYDVNDWGMKFRTSVIRWWKVRL
eukprot:TRINITY_DN6843_c0_g1_i1.p1 TRINITY_DN6843_c0_g1~~TRINITY_DN6843_c0_g1_i1.p1  ORF type:complete len:100 (-),score=7.31 TRINITY_DN6843_c0_g1_i1:315-614(-)